MTVSKSYTRKAISGFSWHSLLKVSTYVLALVKIYFLARLLSPADFGLFSLVAISLGLSEAITQTGVNLTILQSKRSVNYFLDTAWVISLVRGFAIGILMILFGWGMSAYFQQPELLMLTAAAALIPVIKGIINPYIVVLHKKMLFWQDSLYKFSFLFVEIGLSILFGYVFKSAYAFVVAMIGSACFEVVISFVFFQHRPSFNYIHSRAKIIFNNAKWLSLSSVFHYLLENLDDFIIRHLTGTHQLGLYHNAYSLTHKANYQLSKSVHHGIIPILSKIEDKPARLRQAFIKSLLAMVAISTLASLPLLVFTQPIVNFLLGSQWLTITELIPSLIVAGVAQSLIAVCYTLLLAVKQFKLLNVHQGLSLALMIGLMIICGQRQGLVGGVRGIMLSRLLSLPLALIIVVWQLKHD
jgi:O-antigen/teichoic acid export membrane protein